MDVDIPKEEIIAHNSAPKKEASVFPVALRAVEHKELVSKALYLLVLYAIDMPRNPSVPSQSAIR
jgi:hypothetical protein